LKPNVQDGCRVYITTVSHV